MAATEVSDVSDGPVLSVINKRIRALKKKLNRISQMEDSLAKGKTLNKEQEDLLNLLYFGSMFDVKTLQNHFTEVMLSREHERGSCLSYDYMKDDDSIDLLGEGDLDLLSLLSGLLISRPANSSLPHKNALQKCIEHAKLWLENSTQPIEPDSNVTCEYNLFVL
nr:uncharacterized protein LOC109154800 [Ipomoea batatas]